MITVLGASGYIGSHIVQRLQQAGRELYVPGRHEPLGDRELGDIIYCIGMTGDFRTKPFDTVEAHVCVLNKILKECSFSSLTYLSSTRVYINSNKDIAEEADPVLVYPLEADDLYSLTKLTGESLCLASGRPVKVVRLSNVFGKDGGSDTFLADIIKRICDDGTFTLRSSLSSAKDYLFIDDAVNSIVRIAAEGKRKIYNLAYGRNVSNDEIVNELKKYHPFTFNVAENAKEIIFPVISTQNITSEFNFKPAHLLDKITTLLNTV
jgi:nucleoside-diphosphate-sugar epimerase